MHLIEEDIPGRKKCKGKAGGKGGKEDGKAGRQYAFIKAGM
jgi:hypothetical protein